MKVLRPYLSLLCAFLMVHNLCLTPLLADDLYTWQVERVENASQAFITTGFQAGDVALVLEAIPAQFFPLKVKEVHVWWQPPPYYSHHHLAAKVLFYEGATGQLRYILEHAAFMPGLNVIRLGVECEPCEVIFDADDGPGIGIGIQYVTEFDHSVWEGSGHIVNSNQGCWPETNKVFNYSTQTWLDPCLYGMPGNFTIRAKFERLCPQRTGDIDGDMDIDLIDYATLQADATGPGGDVFGTERIRSDLNNDYSIDFEDLAILIANLGGPDMPVTCPPPRDEADTGRDCPSLIRVYDPTVPSDIPPALLVMPLEIDGGTFRWTYTQLAVGLAIGGLLLTFVVGPCVQSGCRAVNRSTFMAEGQIVDETEEQRIRAALDLIGNIGFGGDDDAYWCYWWYMQVGGYNPQVTGTIKVNRVRPEDDVQFAATHGFNKVVIHHTFITGDHWDLWGVDGLALLLFAEWQHQERPNWSERQCQEWLMQYRDRNNLEHIAPEFGHGFGD